jgi:hypothetical protein
MRPGTRARWPRAVLVFLPSIALFAAWYAHSFAARPTGSSPRFETVARGFGARSVPILQRLNRVPDNLIDVYAGHQDEAILIALCLVTVLWAGHPAWSRIRAAAGRLVLIAGSGRLALAAGSRRLALATGGRRLAIATGGRRLAIAAVSVAAGIGYFVLPSELKLQYFVAARMLILSPLLALAAIPPSAPVRLRPWLIAAAPLLTVALLAVILREYRAFSRSMDPLDRLLEQVPPHQKLVGLPFSSYSIHAAHVAYLHIAGYYPARKPGVIGYSFMSLPSSPIRYRDGALSLIEPERELRPWCALLDGQADDADYFLTLGADRGLMAALAPAVEQVDRIDAWALYRRTALISLSEARRAELRARVGCSGE